MNFSIDLEHPHDVFEIILKKAGKEYSVHGEVTSPFDYFLHFFGFTEAMIGLIESPSKCKEILHRFAEAVKKIALEQVSLGVDAVKISSPFAGAGFISPQFYSEFVLPAESSIARAVREKGVPVYIHTCGAINDRLEMMAKSGASGIECLDPPPLGDVLLEEAKRRVGGKIFIKGNLDAVNVLLLGDKRKIISEVRKCLEAGKPGGGYILSTACSIAPHTPRENVQVFAEVVEAFGSY